MLAFASNINLTLGSPGRPGRVPQPAAISSRGGGGRGRGDGHLPGPEGEGPGRQGSAAMAVHRPVPGAGGETFLLECAKEVLSTVITC